MKKILMYLFMVCSLVITSAQNVPDDFKSSFWSNWSIGGDVIFTRDLKHTNWKFASGTNLGLGLMANKQLTKNWGFRIVADIPGFFTADSDCYNRRGKGLIGFSYKLSNNIYLFADGGGAVLYENDPVLKFAADLGIGYIYNIDVKHSIFAEFGADVIAIFPKNFENSNIFVKVGYIYNFGLTKVDRERLANYTEIYSIANEVDVEKEFAKKWNDSSSVYIKKIETLKNENENLIYEITLKDSVIFRLDSILNSIIENGDNFYAMPFSIEFDNDSYVVRQSEYEKVKQIAYIMNSDTNITYIVRGFCDYSGSDEYNQKLSEKRAAEVKRILVDKCGVKEDQLSVDGKGKYVSFGDIKSPINRRVSFLREF